jgi:hypothetical protein
MSVVFEVRVPSKPNGPTVARVEEDAYLRPGDFRGSTTFSQFENGLDERNEILRSVSMQKFDQMLVA